MAAVVAIPNMRLRPAGSMADCGTGRRGDDATASQQRVAALGVTGRAAQRPGIAVDRSLVDAGAAPAVVAVAAAAASPARKRRPHPAAAERSNQTPRADPVVGVMFCDSRSS